MKFDCVIFDMDGTLTVEHLDFGAIRTQMGIADGVGILEGLAEMAPPARTSAEAVLLAHEMAAAREAPAADGACEIVRRIQKAGVATAVLTRNTRPAMEIVLQRFDLAFDVAFAREDGPIKPSPDSIHEACGILGVRCERTACIGDWVFDIEAANAAGCTSVLLARGRRLDFADLADHVIQTLGELGGIVGL